MDYFVVKNRVLRDMSAAHKKAGELLDGMEEIKRKRQVSYSLSSHSDVLVVQYRRSISRIFSELQTKEGHLRHAGSRIVESLEKDVRKAKASNDPYMESHARCNHFRGRFIAEVDKIISERNKLFERWKKIEKMG